MQNTATKTENLLKIRWLSSKSKVSHNPWFNQACVLVSPSYMDCENWGLNIPFFPPCIVREIRYLKRPTEFKGCSDFFGEISTKFRRNWWKFSSRRKTGRKLKWKPVACRIPEVSSPPEVLVEPTACWVAAVRLATAGRLVCRLVKKGKTRKKKENKKSGESLVGVPEYETLILVTTFKNLRICLYEKNIYILLHGCIKSLYRPCLVHVWFYYS